MPAIRAGAASYLAGRKSRYDNYPAPQQSRIPGPAHSRTSSHTSDLGETSTRSRKATSSIVDFDTFIGNKSRPSRGPTTLKFASSSRSFRAVKPDASSQITIDPPESYTTVMPYPSSNHQTHKDDKKFKVPGMPSLPFKVLKPTAHAHQTKPGYAPPPPNKHQRPLLRPRPNLDDELEESFASTMSLHSPPRLAASLPVPEDTPMDISPAPQRVSAPPTQGSALPRVRPLNWTRSASSRGFGRDVANTKKEGSGEKSNKRLGRSALPLEWMAGSQDDQPTPREDSRESFASVRPPLRFTSLLRR